METELIKHLAGYGLPGLVAGLVAVMLGRDFWRVATGRSGGSDGDLTTEFRANNAKFDKVIESLAVSNQTLARLHEEAERTNTRLENIHNEQLRRGQR
jgi:hypothetical protein